ncbi:MAG: polyprenyl synthetase family protein [Alphaproteobacteria bacterium]
MAAFQAALAGAATEVEGELERCLPAGDGRIGRLFAAMRYAAMAGGKRLRPFLVLETGRLFGADPAAALRTAAAVEMVHCYSLVHDDLPAMDDAALRRGRPSCHVAFDEATAILAGDALLTQAFALLAAPAPVADPSVRADLVATLAAAVGPLGMVGGQMIDLAAEGAALDLDELSDLQARKTGALIGFACEAGAILGRAEPAGRAAVVAYAAALGRAFQVADDLLDATGDTTRTGKGAGLDFDRAKATFVTRLGVDGARVEAQRLVGQACDALAAFGPRADLLRDAARFAVTRDH